jgi:molybdopterin molybdotransferase
MSLIPVSEAQQRLFALAGIAEPEIVPLSDAIGRWLSNDVAALRSQPWTDLSAMDGYAIRHADSPGPWTVIGESAAGADVPCAIQAGQAMRIFTGAAMPKGADCVLIQEETERRDTQLVLTGQGPDRPGKHVREQGSDFTAGAPLLARGIRISAPQVALAAIGGHGALPVRRRLTVAIFSTGNELVEPGRQAHPGQLPASNSVMLRALLAPLPVTVEDLGIIPDDLAAQTGAFQRAASADIIITTGGASVGDHDLVKPAFEAAGGTIDFWKIALRPGKPLIAGRKGGALFLGLPGNPVSAFVTATMFLLPLVRHMSGASDPLPPATTARLAQDMPPTAARAEYIRGLISDGAVRPLGDQDSAAMRALAGANALIVRPPHALAAQAGETVECIVLD